MRAKFVRYFLVSCLMDHDRFSHHGTEPRGMGACKGRSAEPKAAAVPRVNKLYSSINPLSVVASIFSWPCFIIACQWFLKLFFCSTIGSWVNRWGPEDSGRCGDFRILMLCCGC